MPLLWKKPRHEKEKRKGKERKGRTEERKHPNARLLDPAHRRLL
jgi:hypothetical protein